MGTYQNERMQKLMKHLFEIENEQVQNMVSSGQYRILFDPLCAEYHKYTHAQRVEILKCVMDHNIGLQQMVHLVGWLLEKTSYSKHQAAADIQVGLSNLLEYMLKGDKP